MRQIARGMRGLSNDEDAQVITDMRGKAPHWFFWTWQQGLISGPITHSKYMAVNASFLYLDKVIAPGVAAVMGKLRNSPDRVFLGEAAAAHWGIIRAVPDAVRSAHQAFTTGMRIPLASELELGARGRSKPFHTVDKALRIGVFGNVYSIMNSLPLRRSMSLVYLAAGPMPSTHFSKC